MTVGGSGFYTLFFEDSRIAYLQPGDSRGPQPWVPSGIDATKATFYELWNTPEWERMCGSKARLQGLQDALDANKLKLIKIVKAPSGQIKHFTYDLCGTTLRPLSDDETTFGLPKVIFFDSPLATDTPSGGRMLAQLKKSAEQKLQDIAELVQTYNPRRIGTDLLVSELQVFHTQVKEVLDS